MSDTEPDGPRRTPGAHVHLNLEDDDEDEGEIRCICGYCEDDGYTIQCEQCLVWQHIVCVGLTEKTVPDHYLCDRCNPRALDARRAHMMQREQMRLREEARRRGLLHRGGANSSGAPSTASGTSSTATSPVGTPSGRGPAFQSGDSLSAAGLSSSSLVSLGSLGALAQTPPAAAGHAESPSGPDSTAPTDDEGHSRALGASRAAKRVNAKTAAASLAPLRLAPGAIEARVYSLLDVYFRLYEQHAQTFMVVKDSLRAPHVEPKLRDILRALSKDAVYPQTPSETQLPELQLPGRVWVPPPARLTRAQLQRASRPVPMAVMQFLQPVATMLDPVDCHGEARLMGHFAAQRIHRGQFVMAIAGEVTDWAAAWKDRGFDEVMLAPGGPIERTGAAALLSASEHARGGPAGARAPAAIAAGLVHQPLLPFVFPHPGTGLWDRHRVVVDARMLGKNDGRFLRFARAEKFERGGNAVLRTVVLEPLPSGDSAVVDRRPSDLWRLQLGVFAKTSIQPGEEIVLDLSELAPLAPLTATGDSPSGAEKDAEAVLCGFPVAGAYMNPNCQLQHMLGQLCAVETMTLAALDLDVMESVWDRTNPAAEGLGQVVPLGGRLAPRLGYAWDRDGLVTMHSGPKQLRGPDAIVARFARAGPGAPLLPVSRLNAPLAVSTGHGDDSGPQVKRKASLATTGAAPKRVRDRHGAAAHTREKSRSLTPDSAALSAPGSGAVAAPLAALPEEPAAGEKLSSRRSFYQVVELDEEPLPRKVVRSGRATATPPASHSAHGGSPVSAGTSPVPPALHTRASTRDSVPQDLDDGLLDQHGRKRKMTEIDQLMADDLFSSVEPRKLSREDRKLMEDVARIARMEREESLRKSRDHGFSTV